MNVFQIISISIGIILSYIYVIYLCLFYNWYLLKHIDCWC